MTPLVIDAHLDIAWNTLIYGRDLRDSVSDKRAREQGSAAQKNNGTALVGLPELLAGGVGLVFSTLYTGPAWANFLPEDKGYETPQQAHDMALEQLQVYEALWAQDQRLRPIRTRQDLQALQAARANGEQVLGMLVLMEGGDPILTPLQFDEWFGRGVRIVGPAWSETRYTGGTVYHGRGAGGLTALGRELLVQMAQRGAILDLSHMDEPAYLEAVDSYQGTLIASHSNPRQWMNSTTNRHLSDAMIKKLAERDGVMGLVAYNTFLHGNRDFATADRANTPLSRYVEAFAYVADLLGTSQHLGIGTDWDGGFGLERIPQGLESHADMPKLAEALSARFSDAQIAGIMGGNFLRLLERALPEARSSRFYHDPNDANSPYLYLTTLGRTSGQARQIEIWYVEHQGKFYLCAENGEQAHWVQNLRANAQVRFIVQAQERAGIAHVLGEGTTLTAVKALFEAKYGWSDGLLVEISEA